MASRIIFKNLIAPLRDKVLTDDGFFSNAWQTFVQSVVERLSPLGLEKSFELTNNQSSAADIDGLSFDKRSVSFAIIDFLIQRVTTGAGATESVSGGSYILYYKPTSNAWAFVSASAVAGVTLSVTAAGQVQYTSTNITGTHLISKITWRAHTLDAKHNSYSQFLGGQ